MDDPQEVTLHHPDILQKAIDLIGSATASPFGDVPSMHERTLIALDNGDLGTALISIDIAQHWTLPGKEQKDAATAAALIRLAFNL